MTSGELMATDRTERSGGATLEQYAEWVGVWKQRAVRAEADRDRVKELLLQVETILQCYFKSPQAANPHNTIYDIYAEVREADLPDIGLHKD